MNENFERLKAAAWLLLDNEWLIASVQLECWRNTVCHSRGWNETEWQIHEFWSFCAAWKLKHRLLCSSLCGLLYAYRPARTFIDFYKSEVYIGIVLLWVSGWATAKICHTGGSMGNLIPGHVISCVFSTLFPASWFQALLYGVLVVRLPDILHTISYCYKSEVYIGIILLRVSCSQKFVIWSAEFMYVTC